MKVPMLMTASLLLTGCAGIDFDAEQEGRTGLVYYEPIPYLFVTVTDKCVSAATVVSLPGKKKMMEFHSGYGASTLTAGFSNGIITAVGQASDNQIPKLLTSIAALAPVIGFVEEAPPACTPSATLYEIINGVPDPNKPINFMIGK